MPKHSRSFSLLLLGASLLSLLGCDLPDNVKEVARTDVKQFHRAEQILSHTQTSLVLAHFPDNEETTRSLTKIRSELDTLAPKIQQLDGMTRSNAGDLQTYTDLIDDSAQVLNRFDGELQPVRAALQDWTSFEKNPQAAVTEWIDEASRIQKTLPLRPLADSARKAEQDWPDKKADLASRLADLTLGTDKLSEHLAQLAAVRSQETIPIAQLQLLYRSEPKLLNDERALEPDYYDLENKISELYFGRDLVLRDLDPEQGRAQWREVITHVSTTPDKPQILMNEWWDRLPEEADLDQLAQSIGLSFERKLPGHYTSESEKSAPEPTEMAYVAPPGQANQYGNWKQDANGEQSWHWFENYAVLSWLLDSQNRVTPTDYRDYRRALASGSTWVGQDPATGKPRFGAFGTNVTNGRAAGFSGSRYASAGAYRNSVYAAPGGTFRNSAYASSRLTASPGSISSGTFRFTSSSSARTGGTPWSGSSLSSGRSSAISGSSGRSYGSLSSSGRSFGSSGGSAGRSFGGGRR